MQIPVVRLELSEHSRQPKLCVCEKIKTRKKMYLTDPEIAAAFAAQYVYNRRLAEEYVYMIGVDPTGLPIAVSEVSHGMSNYVDFRAKEIMIQALKMGATNFFLFHNHCSGNPTPSKEDRYATKIVRDVALMVGIPLLDHIVIGDGTYCVVRVDEEQGEEG